MHGREGNQAGQQVKIEGGTCVAHAVSKHVQAA
jgi:hypothetical protein